MRERSSLFDGLVGWLLGCLVAWFQGFRQFVCWFYLFVSSVTQATKGVTPLLLRDASKGMRSVVSADLCMTSIERMKQQYAATRLCSVFDVDARMFLDDLVRMGG